MKIICDWENCDQTGSYRAPLEKDNSEKNRLLCMDHIKIFHKKWNYFSDMSDQEVEYFVKSDLTWHKATKSFGSSDNFFNILWSNALEDKLNIFKSESFNEYKRTQLSATDRDAFDAMELKYDAKWEEIQKQFKTLVKKYHPDKNQGSRKFEEKLKKITLAYSQLKITIEKKNDRFKSF